jgi:phosphoesterase RecJ-like protein
VFYPSLHQQFRSLLEAIRGKRVVVVGHRRPDGDCIGSQVAFVRFLKAIGIKACAVNADPVPQKLQFLIAETPVIQPAFLSDEWDVALCVDCSDIYRIGPELHARFPNIIASFDHHASNLGFATYDFIDATSAATAHLLAGLFLDAGFDFDAVTAQALFTGIATDTGQFQYRSTTQGVFELAAHLVQCGAKPEVVSQALYEHSSLARIRLLQRFLESLRMEFNGLVCVGILPKAVFDETGASSEDVEGLVEYTRSIEGVEIGVLLEEISGEIKGSLRSKHEAYRVDLLALSFGGGGHRCASGFRLEGTIASIYPEVIQKIREHLDSIKK